MTNKKVFHLVSPIQFPITPKIKVYGVVRGVGRGAVGSSLISITSPTSMKLLKNLKNNIKRITIIQ